MDKEPQPAYQVKIQKEIYERLLAIKKRTKTSIVALANLAMADGLPKIERRFK